MILKEKYKDYKPTNYYDLDHNDPDYNFKFFE
jgi:hypothetical protein